jgi:hypothetical protein
MKLTSKYRKAARRVGEWPDLRKLFTITLLVHVLLDGG